MDDVMAKVNEATLNEQIFGGALFIAAAYYLVWIPMRDKKAGLEVPGLVERIKNDVKKLIDLI